MTVSEQPAGEVAARTYPFGVPERLVFDSTFAELREHEPLAPVRLPYGEPALMVTRHDDVRIVQSDPRFSRAAAATRDRPRLWAPRIPAGISELDPPEHTRLRALVGRAFTVRRVEQLRPRVERIAAELLDEMMRAGPPADMMESFAIPLPATVICELLGVPYDDRDRFRSWTDAFMSVSAVPMEDLSRPPTPHLAFGHGTHHCTGAQLARMELQVGLRALLDRCPELRLAGDAQPRWKVGMVIRGPQALPIAW